MRIARRFYEADGLVLSRSARRKSNAQTLHKFYEGQGGRLLRRILKFTKILFISRVTLGISLSVAESSRAAGLVGRRGKILKHLRRRAVSCEQTGRLKMQASRCAIKFNRVI